MDLLNKSTGTLEPVEQDKLPGSLGSGKYDLVKGSSLDVINPNGELVSIPNRLMMPLLEVDIESQQVLILLTLKIRLNMAKGSVMKLRLLERLLQELQRLVYLIT